MWRTTGGVAARLVLCGAMAVAGAPIKAQETGYTDAQVDAVLSLLPEQARSNAQILVRSEGGLEERRAGTNGWTCWVERFGERFGGNCHHRALDPFLSRKRALSSAPLEGESPAATLAREHQEGRLGIPEGSLEITGYGSVGEDGLPAVLSGRFFLYFPYARGSDLGLPEEAPAEGAPWVHEAGTVQAHVMWSRTLPITRRQ